MVALSGWIGLLLCLYVVILVHEFGHYLVAKRVGIVIEKMYLGILTICTVTLWGLPIKIGLLPIAGAVFPSSESEKKPDSAQFAMIAAGPLASILFGLIASLLVAKSLDPNVVNILAEVSREIVACNYPAYIMLGKLFEVTLSEAGIAGAIYLTGFFSVSIGLLNLIPISPLDGGRLSSLILKQFITVNARLKNVGFAITFVFLCFLVFDLIKSVGEAVTFVGSPFC